MADLAKPALDVVEEGDIKFHPEKFVNTYRHWMTNIKDWCISRQLWWGHQIPAWYYGEGENDFVVARDVEGALQQADIREIRLAGNLRVVELYGHLVQRGPIGAAGETQAGAEPAQRVRVI